MQITRSYCRLAGSPARTTAVRRTPGTCSTTTPSCGTRWLAATPRWGATCHRPGGTQRSLQKQKREQTTFLSPVHDVMTAPQTPRARRVWRRSMRTLLPTSGKVRRTIWMPWLPSWRAATSLICYLCEGAPGCEMGTG
ncbi:uncharacterized protein LOC119445309 [Dermacentor silvarum]|uniref:uncharacterized protein LOC119445309 n=1 Tax=Dermacentor silvarum TaxID=543639 RepID=UPI0021008C61|nr:uncharacterized protein LOC119445309 [Dermacentor silvarum]